MTVYHWTSSPHAGCDPPCLRSGCEPTVSYIFISRHPSQQFVCSRHHLTQMRGVIIFSTKSVWRKSKYTRKFWETGGCSVGYVGHISASLPSSLLANTVSWRGNLALMCLCLTVHPDSWSPLICLSSGLSVWFRCTIKMSWRRLLWIGRCHLIFKWLRLSSESNSCFEKILDVCLWSGREGCWLCRACGWNHFSSPVD